jgi:hypothetical protein
VGGVTHTIVEDGQRVIDCATLNTCNHVGDSRRRGMRHLEIHTSVWHHSPSLNIAGISSPGFTSFFSPNKCLSTPCAVKRLVSTPTATLHLEKRAKSRENTAGPPGLTHTYCCMPGARPTPRAKGQSCRLRHPSWPVQTPETQHCKIEWSRSCGEGLGFRGERLGFEWSRSRGEGLGFRGERLGFEWSDFSWSRRRIESKVCGSSIHLTFRAEKNGSSMLRMLGPVVHSMIG